MENKLFLNKSENIFINDKYEKKEFVTQYEKYFFNIINRINNKYILIPQINLATIINKKNNIYCNELFRNIDFAIFDKKFNIKLLIEINDKSHLKNKRIKRDINVKKICMDANIPIIFFYSKYKNKPEYIINRILKKIEKDY